MNIDNAHNPNAGWQVLGELELPVGASQEGALYGWLTEILHPLQLQKELLSKIIISAQEAVARAIQADLMLKFEHIHLRVFVPSEYYREEQAWGFFRLEKIEEANENRAGGDHAVEFYLYGEGR